MRTIHLHTPLSARPRAPFFPLLLLAALLFPLPARADTALRILTSNLTSGNYQKYEAPGTRILQGLDADVVLMQEFNVGGNTAAEIDAFVDATFGPDFSWYRESGSGIPNGVISRWPIREAGEWNDTSVGDRDFAWARIDLPGDPDLWVVSVHLLTSSSTARNTEAAQLVSYLRAKGIPAGDYLAIGGDLNTATRTEPCVTTLSQLVATAGPYPADQAQDSDTNSSRSKPYDWLLANGPLDALKVPVSIGADDFPYGLVFDSRVYSPLADVYPVQAGDSSATGMQHMAVVRDFLIPGAPEPDRLLITEIMYAPKSGPEWIEVYNPTTADIPLTGLLLTDNEGIDTAEGEFWFGAGLEVPAGEYRVIGAAAAAYVDIVWTGNPVLANTGDEVQLVFDPDHNGLFEAWQVIDATRYVPAWGGGNGRSLSRTCLECDPMQPSSWASSLAAQGTPGAENDTF